MKSLILFLIGVTLAISSYQGFALPIHDISNNTNSTSSSNITNNSDSAVLLNAKEISTAVTDLGKLLENKLPAAYMSEKYVLSNYLKKWNYDVPTAYVKMQEYAEWWKNESIATILDEDWEDMRCRFPFHLDSEDTEGRPILYFELADWDVAGYIKEGGEEAVKNFERYHIMMSEEAEDLVREMRSEGSEITSYRYIVNAAGFDKHLHACSSCLQLYYVRAMQTEFVPYNLKSLVVLNVSPSLESVLSQYHAYTSNVTFYGEDREEWINTLLEEIDTEELPESIAGAYPDSDYLAPEDYYYL